MRKRLKNFARTQSEFIFEYRSEYKPNVNMSKQMMIGSICLSDIPRDKVVVSEKNGKKYLNIVLWINEQEDKYGNNTSIQVGLSKEEREDGVKPTYVGNLKFNKQKVQAESELPF